MTNYLVKVPCQLSGVQYEPGDIVDEETVGVGALRFLLPPNGTYLDRYMGDRPPKERTDGNREEEPNGENDGRGGQPPDGRPEVPRALPTGSGERGGQGRRR